MDFIAWNDVADDRDIARINNSSPDGRFFRVLSAFCVYISGDIFFLFYILRVVRGVAF